MQLDPLAEEPLAGASPRAGGDEAHLLAVGLRRRRQVERTGTGANLVFRELAHREQDPGKLADGEHRQHVGLVLGRVVAPEQTRPARRPVACDAGVMPGRHGLEAEPHGTVEKPAELEVPVALDAGIRRPPERVRLDVGRDDSLLELLGEVEDVVVDPEPGRDSAGVVDVADRAAARVTCPAPELHRGADDLVALFEQERGRDRGVDATRKPNQHPHRASLAEPPGGVGAADTLRSRPAQAAQARSRSTAFGKATRAASMSAPVVAWPRESRT